MNRVRVVWPIEADVEVADDVDRRGVCGHPVEHSRKVVEE
jgi:hypothetical protein